MSHWWCCCDDDDDNCPYGGPPDCQAKPDGTVSWFTHTVNDDNTITRVDHSGKCYTVYVNSTSGDVDETGNGTESRPFVNLNSIFSGYVTKSGASGTLASGVFTPGAAPTEWAAGRLIGAKLTLDGTDYEVTANTTTTATIADPPDDDTYSWTLKIFDDDCIYNICTHADPPDNCPKVKVLVKGKIDYAVVGLSIRNYLRNLVLEPWDVGTIEVDVSSNAGGVLGTRGVAWKSTNVTGTTTTYVWYGFAYCVNSTFDCCEGNGSSLGTVFAFYECSVSAFDQSRGIPVFAPHKQGFTNCASSTFRSCTANGTMAIIGSTYSAFDSCAAIAVNASAGAWGFTQCHHSTFVSCTGDGTGGGIGTSYGFNSCYSSLFSSCDGTAICPTESYGFYGCSFSAFISCTGTATVTALVGNRRACGFHLNTCSSFVDCSTSPVCDDFDNDVEWTEHEIEGVLKLTADHSFTERETIEGVLKLEAEHSILDIRETIEGVLKLEAEHSLVSRETLEGVLKLEITHTLV